MGHYLLKRFNIRGAWVAKWSRFKTTSLGLLTWIQALLPTTKVKVYKQRVGVSSVIVSYLSKFSSQSN